MNARLAASISLFCFAFASNVVIAQPYPINGPTTVNNTVPLNQTLTGGAQDAFSELLVPGDTAVAGSTVQHQAATGSTIMGDLDDSQQIQYQTSPLTWDKIHEYRTAGLSASLGDAPALINGRATADLNNRQHPLAIVVGYLMPTVYGFFFYLAVIFGAISCVALIRTGDLQQWLDKSAAWIGLTVVCVIVAFIAA